MKAPADFKILAATVGTFLLCLGIACSSASQPELPPISTSTFEPTSTLAPASTMATSAVIPKTDLPESALTIAPKSTAKPSPPQRLTLPAQPTPNSPGQTPVPVVSLAATDVIHGTGMRETFDGQAAVLNEEAKVLLAQGQYAEAIDKMKEVQQLLDKPSQVLHNQIGHAYRSLRDFDQAIYHFSMAIEADDNSSDRVNRAMVYWYNHQCQEALQDANIALDMNPITDVGYHTDVEAHLALAECYTRGGQYDLALQHMDLSIAVAKEHGVRPARIGQLSQLRTNIEAIAQGKAYPEDHFSGYVVSDFEAGLASFQEGNDQEAIPFLESARNSHDRPSGRILNLLARSHSALGDHDTAIRYFSEATEVRDIAFNRIWRAIQHFSLDDCEQATADARAALGQEPYGVQGFHSGAEALWITGNCHGMDGRFREAADDLEGAVGLARQHGYLHEDIAHMSEVYEGSLRLAEAEEAILP